jgi:hypothetical protein
MVGRLPLERPIGVRIPGGNQPKIKRLERNSSLHDWFGVAKTMPIPLNSDQFF